MEEFNNINNTPENQESPAEDTNYEETTQQETIFEEQAQEENQNGQPNFTPFNPINYTPVTEVKE